MRALNKFKLSLTPYNHRPRKLSFLFAKYMDINQLTSKKLFWCYFFVKDEVAFLLRRQMITCCGILGFREMKPYGENYNLERNSNCRAIKILPLWAKDRKKNVTKWYAQSADLLEALAGKYFSRRSPLYYNFIIRGCFA